MTPAPKAKRAPRKSKPKMLSQLTRARSELMQLFPYFSTALMRIRFVETPGLKTFGVDVGWKLYYDPSLTWSQMGTRTVLLHELYHLLRRHAQRREVFEQDSGQAIDPTLWNVAADCESNDDIADLIRTTLKGKLRFPSNGGVFPKTYGFRDGETAEYYYNSLKGNSDRNGTNAERNAASRQQMDANNGAPSQGDGASQPCQGGQPQSGQGQPGQSDGDASQPSHGGGGASQPSDGTPGQGGGSGRASQPRPDAMPSRSRDAREQAKQRQERSDAFAQNRETPEPTYDPRTPSSCKRHGGGDCGSAADGIARPWETADPTDVTNEEAARIVDRVVEDAEGMGAGAGVRAFVGLRADAQSTQKQWTRTVSRHIEQHLKKRGRGFTRPSRRFYRTDVFMPGRGNSNPVVVFLVDVSGSIGKAAAQKAFGVVTHFAGSHIDFRVVAFSGTAKQISAREVREGRDVYQGGGTRVGKGLELIHSKVRDAELCIVITDGDVHGEWAPRLNIPTVVFSWGTPGPKWAETVAMPPLN